VKKPDWWPVNPYPADIFIGRRDELATLIPDPNLRTKVAGIMGRMFWDIASDTIWDRMVASDATAVLAGYKDAHLASWLGCREYHDIL
jgi:hypothetical protein